VPHRPSPSLLLIDAGNTRVKYGVCAPPAPGAAQLPVLTTAIAVPCGESVRWDKLTGREIARERLTTAIAGSNPIEVARIVREWPDDWPAPLVINDRRTFPLTIDVDFPDKVGIDRLLGAIAANVIRPAGLPAVIISSGTATTVDYVNADGHFCGGAILPGFDLCAKALHEYTALLPLIEMNEVMLKGFAPLELGRNTHAAITSGLYWGHVGAVKELLHRLKGVARSGDRPQPATGDRSQPAAPHPNSLPGKRGEGDHPKRPLQINVNPTLVLLTGGAAPLLKPHLPATVRSEPHLALQGLAIVVAGMIRTEEFTEGHEGGKVR
jgi:type III pantothenate kinase